jgi:hypothetical protein
VQDEITRRRWAMRQRPQDFKPVEALKAMIHDIESGDLDPAHIVIAYNYPIGDEDHATGYYQAGRFNRLEGMGMMTQVLHIMADRD